MANTNVNSEFNKDELQAPKWLNTDYFEMVLTQHEGSVVKVDSCEITPGTGKGDHYASVMFRAKIYYVIKPTNSDGKKKFISLIIKTTPEEEGAKMDLMGALTLFPTEILMYSKILPKMEKLLRAVGDQTQLCAKMIYSSLVPRQCIIFEDLVEQGYSVISKRSCTFDEVTKVLGILARIHAISYKLVQEGDTEIPKLPDAFIKTAINKFDFMSESIAMFKETISKTEDLKKYVPYMERVEKDLLKEVEKCYDTEGSNILVLNHGDFHFKNLMVNYEENILNNVMLVDFQLCFFGSAVLDLMYAMVMMLSADLRLNHQQIIISNYVETFQETLKKLKFEGKIPTATDFKNEWNKYKNLELYLIINNLAFGYIVLENTIDISDLMENPETRKQIWLSEGLLNELRLQLPRLVEQGYFK